MPRKNKRVPNTGESRSSFYRYQKKLKILNTESQSFNNSSQINKDSYSAKECNP